MPPSPRRQQSAPEHRIAFFQAFLRKPKEVGSIIPSSRFLMRRVVREARVDRARLVVELGPGTGGSTRALLRTMRPDATLLAIEINPRFARLIATSIRDPRLIVHVGSAEDITGALKAHGLPAPDVVLSGIPFSTMPKGLGLSIVREVHHVLAPGGRFVAYQVRDRVEILGRQIFGPARVQTELLNMPPMRIYRWEKQAQSALDQA
jgi:phosphatidylethanolamine/phosphatidyl-N-methylethanolamine N-methyltransferase